MTPPTEPRTDDPAALVEEARAFVRRWPHPECSDTCSMVTRLVDALEQAQAEIEERERRRLAYARQVAGATEATRKEHAAALRAAREPNRGHSAHWIEPRDAEPYACCPAHADYYALLHSRNAVVEAAGAHVDRPGEDGYRALIDAVMALRAAQDPPR